MFLQVLTCLQKIQFTTFYYTLVSVRSNYTVDPTNAALMQICILVSLLLKMFNIPTKKHDE